MQCVYEKGVSGFDIKDVKEAAAVEAEGIVAESEKAPHGIEIRLRGHPDLERACSANAAADCKVEDEHISGGKTELPSHLPSEYPGSVRDSGFRKGW